MKLITQMMAIACGLLTVGTVMDGLFSSGIMTQKAAAVVGRPLTPISGAGVARRTTRRAVYRSGGYGYY
jgi:hypothetical protein